MEEGRQGLGALKKYKGFLLIIFGVFLLFTNFILLSQRFDCIIIHHSAFDKGGYDRIVEIQKKKHPRWKEPAYHLILSNGKGDIPFGYVKATSRYWWLKESVATRNVYCNKNGIHICIIGNYQEHPVPDGLKPAIGHLIKILQKRYGIPDTKILFHRDCNPTFCPGRFITKEEILNWVHKLSGRCPKDIRAQHKKIIANTYLLLIKYTGIVFIVIGIALTSLNSLLSLYQAHRRF